MTFNKFYRSSHKHVYFVEAGTGDMYCKCGNKKGEKDTKKKYNNKSTIYNGISYHSAFEASYAAELDFRKKQGLIRDWERQKKLELKVNGHHITNYYIDFIVWHKDGTREFVECKGYETPEWLLKWRILEATFDQFKIDPDDKMTMIKQKDFKPTFG